MKGRSGLQVSLGRAFRKYRLAAKFSQESFSTSLGMTRIYYGEIERGHKKIELKTLERICKGLDVPIWQVMRDAEADDQ